MEKNLIHETHIDFSGGVNQYPGALLGAENEVDILENGELDQFGPVRKVKGFKRNGNVINSNYQVLGLVGASNSSGTRKLIAINDGASNSDAYTYNPTNGAWTPHGLSLTTGANAEFEQYLDGFFMVNFDDATRWNNLTQWYTTTNVTNAAKAKYIKLYLSRIYLAYVNSGGSTYPSRITYSDLPSGTPLTLTWNDTVNYFDVDPEDGDVIKGLGVNSNRLLIFKENSLHRYDTNSRYKVPGCPGTVSNRSIQNIQGWTLYLHSTGIWGYDGTTSRLLSRGLRDIIKGISTRNFSKACAWVKNDHYYLFVGDVINLEKNINISNCLIDYDITKNALCWRSLSKEPTVFTTYKDDRSSTTYNSASVTYNNADQTYNGLVSSDERVFFGDSLGSVYQFDIGNTMADTDIPFTLETQEYYLGNPSLHKLLRKITVYADGGRQAVIQYKMDGKDWKSLGKLKNRFTELEFPAGSRCQYVKFRILESSSGDSFSFEGFDIYFQPDSLVE